MSTDWSGRCIPGGDSALGVEQSLPLQIRLLASVRTLRREGFRSRSPRPSDLIRTTGWPGGTDSLLLAMCTFCVVRTGRNARGAAKRAVVGRTLMLCIIMVCMLVPVLWGCLIRMPRALGGSRSLMVADSDET